MCATVEALYNIQGGIMNKQHLRRPRIRRAFDIWYKNNSSSFAVPILFKRNNAQGIELRFDNYPDCLSVGLSNDELAVHVEWQGEWWDMIIDLDVWYRKTRGGYLCECCLYEHGETVPVFPSIEAVWQDHLFDPFLKWVNEELAPARCLQISGTVDKGARWAMLIQDESELDKPDPALILLQGLKRVDGTPSYVGGKEGIVNWLVPLK